ncbi:MAG: CBS domain-containing protein, partial [Vicinamibacteria bacterium]
LFPGFPLDGGRVLRALWWWRTGSLGRATRLASEMGKAFAVALMFLGGIQIFTGQLLGGLWLVFIGMFLRGTAERGYQDTLLRQSIEGVPVERVMTRNVISVPPDLSLRRLVDDYFLIHGYRGYPVVDHGRPVGIVGLEHLKGVSRDELDERKVASVMEPFQETHRLSPESSLNEAIERFRTNPIGRLIVTEDERVKGILTRTGLERLLETRRALESY